MNIKYRPARHNVVEYWIVEHFGRINEPAFVPDNKNVTDHMGFFD